MHHLWLSHVWITMLYIIPVGLESCVQSRTGMQWVATRLFVDVDIAYAQRGHAMLLPQPQHTQHSQ